MRYHLIIILLASLTIAANAQYEKLEAFVGPYKGRNVFYINGKPTPPLMYSSTEQGRKTWADPTRQCIVDFTSQGYDIFQTDMWFKYSLSPDETFDMVGIQRQLAGILEVNPEAMILVRINVSAPRWWCEKYPKELCRVTNDTVKKPAFMGNSRESLASERYREFAKRNLKKFLEETEQLPEANRIMGFHIGGAVYGEWHYYGIYDEPDASEPMKKRFSDWAVDKYGNLESINNAWKTGFMSLEELVVPSFDRRYEITDGDFRNPEKDMYVIDYYRCQQTTVSTLVEELAKITKRIWSRPVITGIFYGYFFGNWTVGSQASQADIERMFRSPYLDYFSGPYGSRNMYGSGCFRTLAESVALNGKVWISEHDGATHVGGSGSGNIKFPDLPLDEAQSIARMRRNHMYTFTENAGQWWYDFGPRSQGGGWWSTPRMLTEAKDLLELSQAMMEKPFKKHADVLVVYDMNSFNYVRPAKVDQLTFKITQDMTDALLAAGISLDRIFLMDLELADLSKYKLVIFANTFVLDGEERSFIKEHVLTDGRSVVFISGAGYSDGVKNDPALITDLTGMKIRKAELDSQRLDVHMAGKRFSLEAYGVSSIFKVEDPGAESLGVYVNGETGAARKLVSGCNVYYFGIPLGREHPVFDVILTETGIRTFADHTLKDDYVSVGGGIIGIYTVQGGEKTIKPLMADQFNIRMEPFSSHYFDIRTGALLTKTE